MKYLGYVLVASVFILVLSSSIFKINDPDTFQYLATGRYMLTHGLSNMCVFNYTDHVCQTVFYHEWLFHLITYLVYLVGGFNGLVVLQSTLIVSIFALLLFYAKRRRFSLFSTAIFLLFFALIGPQRFMLRADLFGLLMFTAFFILFNIYFYNRCYEEKGRKKWYKLLPIFIIMVIWANTHGSFPLAYVVIGSFAGVNILRILALWLFSNKKNYERVHELKGIGMILLVSFIAGFINPFGPSAFFGAFDFFSKYAHVLSVQNLEWQSPFIPKDFLRLSILSFTILLGFGLFLLLANIKKLKIMDLILLIPFVYLSVSYVRNVSLFSIVAVLILPYYSDSLIKLSKKFLGKRKKAVQFTLAILSAAIIIFSLKLTIDTIDNSFYKLDQQSRTFGLGVSKVDFPFAAVNFVKQNNIKGKMFNDYGIGAFLNFAVFPHEKTFIDGDTFSLDLLSYFTNIENGSISYKKVADKYKINYFLLGYSSYDTLDMIDKLYKDKGWKLVYFDENAVVFVRNIPQNKNIIDKYAINFETGKNFNPGKIYSGIDTSEYSQAYEDRGLFFAHLSMDNLAFEEFREAVFYDPKNYVAHMNLGSSYLNLEQNDLAKNEYLKAMQIQPNFAPVRFNLGLIYQQEKQYDKAISEFKKSLAINKNYTMANFSLGTIYEAKGDIEDAKTYYRRELLLTPNNAYAQNALTRLGGNSSAAQNTNAISTAPQQQDVEKLIAQVKKSPNSYGLHFQLGVAYGVSGDQKDAMAEFEKTIELKPDFALGYFNLGNAYSIQKDTTNALSNYLNAVKYDPTLADAYLNIGVIYHYNLGDDDKAVYYWQKYLNLKPNDPQAKGIQEEIYTIVKSKTDSNLH